MISDNEWTRLRAAKAAHEADLLRKPNVVGVAIGRRERAGMSTDEPVIVVSVTRKLPLAQLSPADVIPRELDGAPVDVQVTGDLRALIGRAQQVLRAHVHHLLGKRNVVGVGLGYKNVQGTDTGELGLVVSVTQKVPQAGLAAGDMVPPVVEGIRTDVVETGRLVALDLGPSDRWRPVAPPGVSIGHYQITAGTFGCLVHRDGEVFILSNNHVLADVNRGKPGDPVLQPGPTDNGTAGDRIAALADFVPLDFGTAPADCPVAQKSARLLNTIAGAFGSRHRLQAVKQTEGVNRVDAALARPLSPDLVRAEILYIGAPIGVGTVTLGTRVQKTGRTSGYTHGVVTQIEATLRIDYSGSSALFSGQFVAGPMSRAGDSGSAVLDMDRRVVGLLFAGSDAATICSPINQVLSDLNVELVL